MTWLTRITNTLTHPIVCDLLDDVLTMGIQSANVAGAL